MKLADANKVASDEFDVLITLILAYVTILYITDMVRVGKFDYQLSSRKGKKLMTVVDGKTIHFGDSNFQQFFDKTGLLPKKMNHMDARRRKNYLARAKGITGWKDPDTANYHAIRILW